MFSARLLVLLLPLLSATFAERSKKPVRAAVVNDPQPVPAATRVPNYDPAPYSSIFNPENLDLTGFFGPQFINTKQHPGIDLKSLYAQYGSPHQHFAFTFPSKGAKQPGLVLRQPSPQEYIPKKQRLPQLPHKVEVPIPVPAPTKQASEESEQYYHQGPIYGHQQQHFVGAHHPALAGHPHAGAPPPQQYQYVSHPGYSRPQAAGPFYLTHPPAEAQRPPPVHHQAIQPQVRPTAAAHYAQAYPSPSPSAHPVQYSSQFQAPAYGHQPQAEAPQAPSAEVIQQLAAAAAAKQPKFNIQAVIQSQVLPQLKDQQGIQLLDLSEFYPPKDGQQPTYYQVNPAADFKSATFTPVDLNQLYMHHQQPQQQHQQQQRTKTSSSIPAAAIREPTFNAAELESLLQQQHGAYQPAVHNQAVVAGHPSQQPGRPASYAYVSSSQSTGGPLRQHQIDLNAYYAQPQRPDSAANVVYGSHPGQYAVHDDPQQQPAVYYTQQPSAPPTEEVAPSSSPTEDTQQFFKSTVAKPVKRGPKPTQLAHLASPLPNPTPNPTAPSKPSKTRQLVKKPHLYGQGYSFELSG